MAREKLKDRVAVYNVKLTYDSEGFIFDINVSDGYNSVSVVNLKDIIDVIREIERREEL